MRIRITLAPLSYPAAVPANHHPLASFLYEAVAVAAPELAGFLHHDGLRAGATQESDKRFKFFVFAVPELPRYTFHDDHKWFESGVVYWQVSSPLPEFIEALVTGLAAQGLVRLGSTPYEVAGIEILMPPVFTERMRLIALSPLTVATTVPGADGRRSKHYVRAHEASFAPLIASNLREKYRTLYGQEPDDPELQFAFDEEYIQHAGGFDSRQVTRLIQYKGTKIKSYLAPFIVAGDPELIRLGWECGFGSGNSQGFGMAGS